MSLRYPRGADFEQPEKEGALEAGVKRFHTLRSLGRTWLCSCGKVYSWAKSRKDATTCQSIHVKAVIEFLTDQREGRSTYNND